MRCKQTLLFFAVVLGCSAIAHAQQWSGILASTRAMDWSTAGVVGGIPNRTTICATLNPGATAAQINTAITNCGTGQVVYLNAGTYNLTAGILLNTSNITVRGAGASATVLKFTGETAVTCHIGGLSRAFQMCTNGGTNIGVDSPENTATWSSGYAQGTTVITLSAHTNLTVGSAIWLDQLDESSDGYPATGDIWTTTWQDGESYLRANRGLTEGHIVTACGTSTPGAACTSNTITIEPGVMMPDVRSSQSPGAWWGNPATLLHDTGVEDLTIDGTPAPDNAFMMINCTNCWAKGIRTLYTGTLSGGSWRINFFVNLVHCSIVDSYFYGPQASGYIDIYGVATGPMSASLFQNNIFHAGMNHFIPNTATYGNVFAYNYWNDVGVDPTYVQSSMQLHGVASFDLFEGNAARNFTSDNIHSGHFFWTFFRNHFESAAVNPSGAEANEGNALYAVSRFFNVVGNVFGSSYWRQYQNPQPPANQQYPQSTYQLGWRGTNSVGAPFTGDDARTAITLLRWGNWDNVTSTNDTGTNDQTGTRWCGSAPLPSNCGGTSEVPSGINNYSNPVPASQTLPPSFYLTAQPAWWTSPYATVPWPPIGPDVANGTATNTSSYPTGGHANKTPARLCFENIGNDAAYASSSPSIKAFDRATCYGQSRGSLAPSAPSNLKVQ